MLSFCSFFFVKNPDYLGESFYQQVFQVGPRSFLEGLVKGEKYQYFQFKNLPDWRNSGRNCKLVGASPGFVNSVFFFASQGANLL